MLEKVLVTATTMETKILLFLDFIFWGHMQIKSFLLKIQSVANCIYAYRSPPTGPRTPFEA